MSKDKDKAKAKIHKSKILQRFRDHGCFQWHSSLSYFMEEMHGMTPEETQDSLDELTTTGRLIFHDGKNRGAGSYPSYYETPKGVLDRLEMYWYGFLHSSETTSKIVDRIRRFKFWFYHRWHPRHRYNIVKTGLPPGYYDADSRMEAAIIKEFQRWFEREYNLNSNYPVILEWAYSLSKNPSLIQGGGAYDALMTELLTVIIAHRRYYWF